MKGSFSSCFKNSFYPALSISGSSTSPLPSSPLLLKGSGSLTGSYTILIAASAPFTLNHGDGNTTNVITSSEPLPYVITYAGVTNPEITVSNPENVTGLVLDEMTSDFTVRFSDVSNEDRLVNLHLFSNIGDNKANTIGNPTTEFIDNGSLILLIE